MTHQQENVICIYQDLASSDHDSDNGFTPDDLVFAMEELYTSDGETFTGDYCEAVDWASHLVAQQHREDHPGEWKDGLTEREADYQRAACRDGNGDGDDDGDEYDADGDRIIGVGGNAVICLSTYREEGHIVRYAP